jgi:phosphate transport system protein
MDSNNISHHISQKFDEEMETLHNQVLKMGGLVEQQITGAIKALQNTHAPDAEKIILQDHKVNALEVAIDEACMRILASLISSASAMKQKG